MKRQLSRIAFVLVFVVGCASGNRSEPAAVPEPAGPPAAAAAGAALAEGPDDARGARLYDNWRSEKKLGEAFVVDSTKTPELDGKGGPNGNGTLNDGAGKPLPNSGHDYRLKNLFGWDLRGKDGIYGPDYQNKAYVLAHNLLEDARPAAELRSWFANGADGVPALGAVLDEADIDQLVAFVELTRSGRLARPEQVFRLEKSAPKGFVLNSGANAARGQELYQSTCAGCHGADGRKIPIDETESVGTLARTAAYEIWFKIAHGHPGSAMERQVTAPTGAEQARGILDLLAALCDRQAFPPLSGAADVPQGDARCGAYLR